MSTELKITKEAVLAAAAKCNTAKETLKTLFPEVFTKEHITDLHGSPDYPCIYHKQLAVIDGSAHFKAGLKLNTYKYNYEIKGDRLLITEK